jgi:uncharacterized protein YndB with AHSA1/START domain
MPTLMLMLLALSASAQAISETSLVQKTGERVLRIEATVTAAPDKVWPLFTTVEGLRRWVAPVMALDLRSGGSMLANYRKDAKLTDADTIRNDIPTYLEGNLIIYKVHLTATFPEKTRAEDKNLQEVVQITDAGGGKTKIVSSMIGWGTGPEWDKVYEFFRKGNTWTFEQLIKAVP